MPAGSASINLSSAVGVNNAPFAVGMALVEGQFPDEIAVGNVLAAQVNVRNRWPDGSAKIVLVSGRCTLAAGSTVTAVLQRGTAAAGAALTEAELLASGIEATLQFAGGIPVSLRALVEAGGRPLATGKQMSSWLYGASASASNKHLMAWFEVRFFGGDQVQVVPWLENGFTRLSACAGQAGALVFTLGGSTRFSQADVHIGSHCRVYAQSGSGAGHWLAAAPDLYAAPAPSYLQSTGLVPSYFPDTRGQSRLNELAQAYSPSAYGQLTSSPRDVEGSGTNNGDFDAGMGAAGYHAGIGPLPEWDVFYLTSGEQRAWNAVLANAMGYGRYGVHFRDELTLRAVNPADVPNKTLPQGSNYNISDIGANQYGAAETLPTVAPYVADGKALKPEYWAYTHHPSAGFLAYLLTGHECFLELTQMVAATCFLRQNNVHRSYAKGLLIGSNETTRGAAWSLRSMFQAATISRDGDALQTGFAAIVANNIAYYHANYVAKPCGSFGVPRPYSNFATTGSVYRVNAWELDFWVGTWGYGLDLKVPTTQATRDQAAQFFSWTAQWIVGRLGPLADAASYGFTGAARQFSVAIAPIASDAAWTNNAGPWFANWGEAYMATYALSNAINVGNSLGGFVGANANGDNGFFPDATSYWGNLQYAISYAVRHSAAGASDAYLRMINASDWGLFEAAARSRPVWSLRALNAPR